MWWPAFAMPSRLNTLKNEMPEAYKQFMDITAKLEKHYKDMQDVEFTIERGKLWMLQTRNGKRTAKAAVKIAVDMANEGLITKEEAVCASLPDQVDTCCTRSSMQQRIEAAEESKAAICQGRECLPGRGSWTGLLRRRHGREDGQGEKQDVIMVRPFTKPDDVHGMIASKGVLTSEGGATSHAAVVARQFGIPCVVGASSMKIDLEKRADESGRQGRQGRRLDLGGWHDRTSVHRQDPDRDSPSLEEQTELLTLLSWADEICRPTRNPHRWLMASRHRGLQVWANADYPKDARRARSYGASGHRPVPHRAYVLRARASADRPADDPGRRPAKNAQQL